MVIEQGNSMSHDLRSGVTCFCGDLEWTRLEVFEVNVDKAFLAMSLSSVKASTHSWNFINVISSDSLLSL